MPSLFTETDIIMPETILDVAQSGTLPSWRIDADLSSGGRPFHQIQSSRPVFTRSDLPGGALLFCSPGHIRAEVIFNW
jgi:hypothetical protein